uniref:Anaphase-promoting complex subunit 10 n=1 Tax=Meloidogyne javanica TaxID=6303 RepID=A0A915N1L4_MELJA
MVNDNSGKNFGRSWMSCLPEGVGHINDISNEAVWTLSSAKEGMGIHQLLDDREDTFWQSDGLQPHTITIEFQRRTPIDFLVVYLDYKLDEIQIQTGSSVLDLEDPKTVTFSEPTGWQLIDLRKEKTSKKQQSSQQAFAIVIQIVQNHQNGRDTHIRGLRVLGPGSAHKNMLIRALARNEALAQHFSDLYFKKTIFSNGTIR